MRIFWLLVLLLFAGCASGPDEIVQPATQASSPSPVYPVMSSRLGEQGRVILRVQVLANGNAGEVQLVRGSEFERLNVSAIAAAKKFKFNPARTRSGRAVDSWTNLPIQYRLE